MEISINGNVKGMMVKCWAENVSNSPVRSMMLSGGNGNKGLSAKKADCCLSLLLTFSLSFHANGLRILNDSCLNN